MNWLQTHKALTGQSPDYINDLLTPVADVTLITAHF